MDPQASAPHLNCEIPGLTLLEASAILVSALESWGQERLLGFGRRGSGRSQYLGAFLFSVDDVEQIVREAGESEKVVSILDLTAMAGCEFDIGTDDDCPDPDLVNFQLSAWGKYEAMIEGVAKTHAVETFRNLKTKTSR